MLRLVDAVAQTAMHRCDECGSIRVVSLARIQVTTENIIIGPCPACLANGLTVNENFRRDMTRADTGEMIHPQSMVGTVFHDTGGVVVEDSRFESPHHRKVQALLIRALMAALGLTLAPDPQAKH